MSTDETDRDGSGAPRLVLASGSPRRLSLLGQMGVEPDVVLPASIDETPLKGEQPRTLAKRLARTKCEMVMRQSDRREDVDGAYILSADTVVSVGRRVLPKAELLEDAANCLRVLSGRNHRVFTAICLSTPRRDTRVRLVEARVRFKRLSRDEVESYLASGEWRGKAGGYAVQGIAGAFVVKLVGSYSAVVGLPLYETMRLLDGGGYPVRYGWLNAGGQ